MAHVSVVGLGKLGAPMAAAMAHRGHTVIGVDLDRRTVALINRGQAPVFEPGLADLLVRARERLSATEDYDFAIMHTEITFIVVPTPSEEDGSFSLRYVLAAARSMGQALQHKEGYHLVVLTSTVMPGSTGGPVQAILEEASGKQCGRDFGLCYSPEFIALGSVIRDLLNPDLVLIGESDPYAGDILAAFYRSTCENNPPIARMNFVNAELAKIALNTFVTTKITFANMLARICERLPGGDVDAVTGALGLDSRVGPRYLKGAIGYGGPCFPRDNKALAHLAGQVGVRALLAEATDAMNRQQVLELREIVKRHLPESGRVAILGLAYKPHTDVVEESQGVGLARLLADEGIATSVYDPAAMENARKILGPTVTFAPSLEQCIGEADVIVITTPWPEFKHLEPGNPGHPTVIDCWRILDSDRCRETADYVALGIGPQGR